MRAWVSTPLSQDFVVVVGDGNPAGTCMAPDGAAFYSLLEIGMSSGILACQPWHLPAATERSLFAFRISFYQSSEQMRYDMEYNFWRLLREMGNGTCWYEPKRMPVLITVGCSRISCRERCGRRRPRRYVHTRGTGVAKDNAYHEVYSRLL